MGTGSVDHYFKEDAMTGVPDPQPKPKPRRRPQTHARMPLATRIALGIIGAVALAAAVIAGVNIYTVSSFNSATGSLQSNIASFNKKPSLSKKQLDDLAASQKNVDESFKDLQNNSLLAAPGLKNSIRHNADVSRALTRKIADAREEGTAADQQGTASSQEPSGRQDSDSTEDKEDEEKTQKLLRQNSTDQQAVPSPDKSPQPTVKPW